MTNEEKAREIANEVSVSYGFGLNCDSSVECYNAAMEMAAWKDEQFDKAVAVIKALESLQAKQREMSRIFAGGSNTPAPEGMYDLNK